MLNKLCNYISAINRQPQPQTEILETKPKIIETIIHAKYIPNTNCIISLSFDRSIKNRDILSRGIRVINLGESGEKSISAFADNNISILTDESIKEISISFNSKYLVAVTGSGTLKIWQIKQQKTIALQVNFANTHDTKIIYGNNSHNQNKLEFSHDNQHLVAMSDKYITLLSVDENEQWNTKFQLNRQPAYDSNAKKNSTIIYYNKVGAFHFKDNTLLFALTKQLKIKGNNWYDIEPKRSIPCFSCDLKDNYKLTKIAENNYKNADSMIFSPNGDHLIVLHQGKLDFIPIVETGKYFSFAVCEQDNESIIGGKFFHIKFLFNAKGDKLFLRNQRLFRMYELNEKKEWVSTAITLPKRRKSDNSYFDISPDGKYLAISFLNDVDIYEKDKKNIQGYSCTKSIKSSNSYFPIYYPILQLFFKENKQLVITRADSVITYDL